MFQRLCKGAIQISKTAVYADVDQTPIFTLSFETVVIFKNRVELNRVDKVKSLEDINFKISSLQEEIRTSKKTIRWYRDLIHKVYCLHVYKGKQKISSMIYVEIAKVNFGDVGEVTADQLAWLSMDYQILQYNLGRYRNSVKRDKNFEKNCSRLKLNSILENALEEPSRVFVLAFLGKSYEFVKANLDVYRTLKASEQGIYNKPGFLRDYLASTTRKPQGIDEDLNQEEARSQHTRSQSPSNDEMKEARLGPKRRISGQRDTLGPSENKTRGRRTTADYKDDQFDQPFERIKSSQKNNAARERPLAGKPSKSKRYPGVERSDESHDELNQPGESSEEEEFERVQRSTAAKVPKSKTQEIIKPSKPRPRINDDRTTAKLKSIQLRDLKKFDIAGYKTDDEESTDSFVENIFDKVIGESKRKDKSGGFLTDLNKTGKPGKGQRSLAGTGKAKTMQSDSYAEMAAADEDERFNMPKGKLVAMISRLEMRDLQTTQLLETSQAELETLKEDMLRLALKVQTLKSTYKTAKSNRELLESENRKLADENQTLRQDVESLMGDKLASQAQIAELQSALDSTRLDLR